MFTNTAYEQRLFEYLTSIRSTILATPVYLGATASGTGTPAGGWTGYLPQSRVSYDANELATAGNNEIPTLLDNLNHIRYNIATLSGSVVSGTYNPGVTLKEAGSVIASGITILDFGEGFSVGTVGEDGVLITYSGTEAGHIIAYSGVPLTARSTLDFYGDVTVIDDEINDKTKVTITASGGGSGVTDHGLLTGLADDDHSQYYNEARGDVRYSQLTHEHDLAYAPIGEGVTGGDSHDHSGGDGGQIDHGGLSGLVDDDHAQYYNEVRGDARYSQLSHDHDGVYLPVASGLGHIITYSGVPLTQRTNLNFVGDITVVDDSGSDSTTITVTGGTSAESDGGWVDKSVDTWTYYNSTNFTISGQDLTLEYPIGARLRLVQGGTTKYFIVMWSDYILGDTTVTVYGGNAYVLTSETISSNYISYGLSPVGFGVPEYPGLPEKSDLVGDDLFVIEDSAVSYIKKKVKRSSIGKEVLTANRTYYVRTDGSDSNDGLTDSSGGAFLTIQAAIDTVSAKIDAASYVVTISVGDGTYTSGIELKDVVGGGPRNSLIIQGNTTTPANCIISTTNENCIVGEYVTSFWSVRGFKLTASGSPSRAIQLTHTKLSIWNIVFHTCIQHHIDIGYFSIILIETDYAITGTPTVHHWLADKNSIIYCYGKTVTVTAGLTFNTFCVAARNSLVYTPVMTFTNSCTCKRYDATILSSINVGGSSTYFPGNVAGTTATGSIYA